MCRQGQAASNMVLVCHLSHCLQGMFVVPRLGWDGWHWSGAPHFSAGRRERQRTLGLDLGSPPLDEWRHCCNKACFLHRCCGTNPAVCCALGQKSISVVLSREGTPQRRYCCLRYSPQSCLFICLAVGSLTNPDSDPAATSALHQWALEGTKGFWEPQRQRRDRCEQRELPAEILSHPTLLLAWRSTEG